jgi:hypothetical protein
MSAPIVARGADVAAVQKLVLSVMRGRAYRSHIPSELRLHVIADRVVAHGKPLALAALGARAVANYLAAIGDQQASDRWNEMADDLDFLSNRRPPAEHMVERPAWDWDLQNRLHSEYCKAFRPWDLKCIEGGLDGRLHHENP